MQDWQQDKATAINGPFNSFRLIADAINFFPVPVAGQQCFFEYISSNWISKNAGGSSAIWTNDLDVPKLDDQLIVMGTIWRWKNAKGLDYSEDFAKYERRVIDAIGRDAGKPVLNMTGGYYQIQPVVAVPRGSFGA